MDKLTPKLIEFINDNKDVIEAYDFEKLYHNAYFSLSDDNTGKLTLALMSAGIDPLLTPDKNGKLLDYIPNYYLSDTDIMSFKIPTHITRLAEGCFADTKLNSIEIPPSVKQLDDFVFYQCFDLDSVKIPESVTDFGNMVFYGAQCVIMCEEGSAADKYAQEQKMETMYI